MRKNGKNAKILYFSLVCFQYFLVSCRSVCGSQLLLALFCRFCRCCYYYFSKKNKIVKPFKNILFRLLNSLEFFLLFPEKLEKMDLKKTILFLCVLFSFYLFILFLFSFHILAHKSIHSDIFRLQPSNDSGTKMMKNANISVVA